ncbi:MAG TPA: hypothetical protein VMH83_10895 [Candidatus Acidoferrum sp.]|nr:hypothetical protein [Candidatus Acidoferrum sp.]
MNVIVTLLVLILLGCAVTALLPVLGFLLALIVAGGCLLVWLLPILIIANSDKTTGGEKAAWILAIVFLSWFAWVFYFFLAPLKPRPRYYPYY